ncbi:MAG: oligosaccharide flippase family protein [Thermodesulfobacteriota bacterium]|nr:oligosaccharide flippase family protein [Thermodesulfobacteriota bacterium]
MKKLKDLFRMLMKPEERSLKIKTIRAAAWSMLGRGGSRILRLASSLVLTRILFPEAFGLMATATVMLAMIQLFADTGVKTAIIQNPRGAEPQFLNTAWIISICRGVLLFFIVAGMSWPMSRFYGQPELMGLLLLMALNPLISGFENPALVLFIKQFRVEKQVAYELGTHLLSIITSIILAIILNSVYALAIGSVSLVFYRVSASYIIEPYRPHFAWDKESGSELLSFGKYIFLNTLITWAAMNGDVILIGKLLNMDLLGLYNLGKNIGQVVITFCLLVFMQAYMPAVSSVLHDLPRVMRIYQRTSALVLTIAIPLSVVIALFAEDIIRLLYDPRYLMASIGVFWISLSGVFHVISLITSNTFIAMGRPVYETIAMAIGLILVGVFIPLGASREGLNGAAFGMFAAITLITVVESVILVRGIKFSLKTVLRPWFQTLTVSAAIGGIFYLLRPWLESDHFFNFPFLIIMTVIGLLVSGGVYIFLEGRHPFRDQEGATKIGVSNQ